MHGKNGTGHMINLTMGEGLYFEKIQCQYVLDTDISRMLPLYVAELPHLRRHIMEGGFGHVARMIEATYAFGVLKLETTNDCVSFDRINGANLVIWLSNNR